jgi:hypothetical protein
MNSLGLNFVSSSDRVIVIELLYLRVLQAAETAARMGGPAALRDQAFIQGLQRGYLEARVVSDADHDSLMRRGGDAYKAGLLCGQCFAGARDFDSNAGKAEHAAR